MRDKILLGLVLFFGVFIFTGENCFSDDRHVYATWDTIELDTCASAWLIKNFVDPQAEFIFLPKGQIVTRGMAFDTPDAKWRRTQNMSTFEAILQEYKIQDAALKKIGDLIHAVEINYWQDRALKQALKLNQEILKIKEQSRLPQEMLSLSFPVFQTLYDSLKSQGGGQPTLPKAPYVLSQTVKQWLADGRKIGFIDVRDLKEFKAGHLEGAVNIPYDEVEWHLKKINRQEPQVIYCTYSAWRAPYAANALADAGFDNVYILEGGISAWHAGGQVIYAIPPNQTAEIIPYASNLKKTFKHPKDREYKEKTNLTLEELGRFNGKEGRLAYVAVDGIIYDVTQSRLWRGGIHDPSKGEATAGRDLTEILKKSPHGDKHLKDFPIVGQLIQKK